MARLTWDGTGERVYETGSSHAVLYPAITEYDSTNKTWYGKGVAWNGFTGCDESPDGADITKKYANNGEYVSFRAAESLNFTIKAFTYPNEWKECDGRRSTTAVPGFAIGQQTRKRFGFTYQTIKGNDTQENDYGVIYHIYYGCTASPSDRSYETVNDSPDNIEFSWECATTPVTIPYTSTLGQDLGLTNDTKMVSLEIDSTTLTQAQISALETALYGVASPNANDAMLPDPEEIYRIIKTATAQG